MGNQIENQEAKRPAGQPPFYSDPEVMQAGIDEYFASIERDPGRRATIAGLAYHLGFASRQSLNDYEKDMGDKFAYIVKRAKLFIENNYAETCISSKAAPIGNIFMLKANFGYRDNIDVNLGGQEDNKLNINIITVPPLSPVNITSDSD